MGLIMWAERRMKARGVAPKRRAAFVQYSRAVGEQLQAMVPISLLQVIVLAVFFSKSSATPALDAAGLISATVGLVLFLDGLRVCVMPLAIEVGTQLPKKLKLGWVLLVAFCLGVLVTYAEPALASLRPLATLVDPATAPYLYYLMNQQQEIMVLSVGLGVGVAAVIGMLKFLYNIPLKWLIAACLLPTIGASCYMQWGNRHLSPILGLAWDCGGVTTGPVTVPILLSLGVGVMSAQRQKKAALAVLEDAAINRSEGNTLEGFGIVTLASLLPVLAVELMAIITSFTHSYEYVLEQAALAAERTRTTTPSVVDTSPVKEVVFAVRAISPLIVVLLFLVLVVLRRPLPSVHFIAALPDEETEGSGKGEDEEDGMDDTAHGLPKDPSKVAEAADVEACKDAGAMPSPFAARTPPAPPAPPAPADIGSAVARFARKSMAALGAGPADDEEPEKRDHRVTAAVLLANNDTTVALPGAPSMSGDSDLQTVSSLPGSVAGSDGDSALTGGSRAAAFFSKYGRLLLGILMTQIGMILFNLGLTYGFTALGDLTGSTLPAAFLKLPYEPASPFYSWAGGITLCMVTIFMLGMLATKAEPALNVLGQTVEDLSQGKFTKSALVWSVCFGVAIGMCAGASKILFQVPLIWFLLAKYTVACGLTSITSEAITAVAWDSAGVTTGPVTVPFVMSIGVGFAKAVQAPEGFGMLTVMSVAPIISVLFVSLMRKPVKRAASELARLSKVSSLTVKVTGGLDKLSKLPEVALAKMSTFKDSSVRAGRPSSGDGSVRAGRRSPASPDASSHGGNAA